MIGPLPGWRRELDERAHRVVDLGGDPHAAHLWRRPLTSRATCHVARVSTVALPRSGRSSRRTATSCSCTRGGSPATPTARTSCRRRCCARCAPIRACATPSTCARGCTASPRRPRSTTTAARRREVLTGRAAGAAAEPEHYDDAFESLIAGLPDTAQAALRLRFVEDLDYDGIAPGSAARPSPRASASRPPSAPSATRGSPHDPPPAPARPPSPPPPCARGSPTPSTPASTRRSARCSSSRASAASSASASAEEPVDALLAEVAAGLGPRIVASDRELAATRDASRPTSRATDERLDLPVDLALVRSRSAARRSRSCGPRRPRARSSPTAARPPHRAPEAPARSAPPARPTRCRSSSPATGCCPGRRRRQLRRRPGAQAPAARPRGAILSRYCSSTATDSMTIGSVGCSVGPGDALGATLDHDRVRTARPTGATPIRSTSWPRVPCRAARSRAAARRPRR